VQGNEDYDDVRMSGMRFWKAFLKLPARCFKRAFYFTTSICIGSEDIQFLQADLFH
jgi:hypothetical protein